MTKPTTVPKLHQAMQDAITRAHRDVDRLYAGGDGVDDVAHAAAVLADIGRVMTWNGEVIERDCRSIRQGYGEDRRPADRNA
jgi:hypothetical protein